MISADAFGSSVEMEVVRFKDGAPERLNVQVATEVPCTITANGDEVATMQCTPDSLHEFAVGFLYTAGLINGASEILEYDLDERTWRVDTVLTRKPDPQLLTRRVYTSGCGRGVTFSTIGELSQRVPIQSSLSISASQIHNLSHWLQRCSELYRITGAVHTAALSVQGELPQIFLDDIGRHTAVDKVIGKGLLEAIDFKKVIIITSGRTSSEILHKAYRAGIPILIARGAPTHQTVLRARDMGICVVGFARGGGFTVYSNSERITP